MIRKNTIEVIIRKRMKELRAENRASQKAHPTWLIDWGQAINGTKIEELQLIITRYRAARARGEPL